MPRFPAVLLLAALLLSPAAAQTSSPATVTTRSVSIQVTLVSVFVADVDALGVNFDLMPLPAPHTYLRYATGNIVAQLYQTLIRTHGHALPLAPITAVGNLPITTAVDAKVPDYTTSVEMSNGPPTVRSLLGYFQLHGKLTLTPYITADNLVALDINPSNSKDKPIRFRPIPSGSSLVIAVPNVQGTDTPVLGSIYRLPDSLTKTDELLIFLTPTIDVTHGDLRAVVAEVEKQTGIKAIVRDSDQSYRPVTLHFQEASLPKSLRY